MLGKYTSQDGDSVRDRVCRECDHRWRTLQPPEEVLDPSILVKFPRWKSPEGSRRQVTLEYATKARRLGAQYYLFVMPKGPGTYGTQKGRPPKKKKGMKKGSKKMRCSCGQ